MRDEVPRPPRPTFLETPPARRDAFLARHLEA